MRTLHLPNSDWIGGRKPVNIAVVGDSGHGKTTLVASLLRAQHRRLGVPLPPSRGLANDPVCQSLDNDWQYAPTTSGTMAITASERRLWQLLDCPGGENGLVDSISLLSLADGAVFVVSCRKRVTHHLRSMAYAATQAGIRHAIGFINIDGGSFLPADGVEIELRRVLIEAGFPGDDVAVVRGSGRAAMMVEAGERFPRWVDALADAIEIGLPTPVRDEEGPFQLLVQNDRSMASDSFARHPASFCLSGVLRQGTLAAGMEAECFAANQGSAFVTVANLVHFKESIREAGPGAWVRAEVITRPDCAAHLYPYDTLVAPGQSVYASKLMARICHLGFDEGGRRRSIQSGMQPHFSLGNAYFRAPVRVLSDSGEIAPGQTEKIEITLPGGHLRFQAGQGFVCRWRKRVMAIGWLESMVE